MRMLLTLLALLVAVPAVSEGKEEPAATATLTRRLAEFPVGSYVMVQSFDEKVRHKLEVQGEAKPEKKTRLWNRFTFDLEIVAVKHGETTRREAHVVVRRVQVGIEGDQDLTYDSDGKPEKQSEVLLRQFRYMVGGEAKLDLATFGEGGGFEGLTAVWDEFLEENPGYGRAAESNRRNYGDSRLDRMFARGLPVLFGPEAGRAAGRTRKLAAGESWEIELEILGIGRENAMSKHAVKVETVADGHATLVATWAENGHNPKIDGTVILMRGGDIKGRSEMTFHLSSGLLVGLNETEKRVDQTCGMDMVQRTRYATSVSEFSIEAK